ncbi:hypothetical protein ACC862_37435, partial [Rhizobium ruizarguesonis]
SGAFGTALAAVIALAGRSAVTLVGRDPSLIADLKAERLHDAVLPGILLPDQIGANKSERDAIGLGIQLVQMLDMRRTRIHAHVQMSR